LRLAQRTQQAADEPPAGNADESASPGDKDSGADFSTHEEQQSAELNQLASNLADAEERRKARVQEIADWEERLEQFAAEGPDEPRPYSFLDLDKRRDNLAVERHNTAQIADAVALARESLAHAADQQDDHERELRRAKDELEHNDDPSASSKLAQTVADAEHEVAAAKQLVALRRAELANLRLKQQVQALREQHAEQLVAAYEQDVAFTPIMRSEVLTELDAKSKATAERAKQLADDLAKFLQPQWYQAREKLDAARAADDEDRLATVAAEAHAKDLAQQLADFEIALSVSKLDRLKDERQTWERRFAAANSQHTSADTDDWVDDARAAENRLRVEAASLQSKIESTQKQLDSIEKELQSADKDDAQLRYWLTQSSDALELQRRLTERALAELEPSRRLFDKLEDDLTGDTFSATAARWLGKGRKNLHLVWDYEVANIQDRPLTVGRIVKGLSIFVLGLFAARILSRAFGRRLLSRMGVNASASAAFQSLAFYLLVLLFSLFALKLVEVPLTAFTVLGGAVALGVGFGSQNIVNNFISGLILLAERPVKVGDLIQIENIYGNVEHIGARSTRVKTGDNLDIIVPNSTFLETNVVNWTLSDNNMRTNVAFGVAYGSPTGKVSHLAQKAAANHDRVFERPAAFVLFNNFGDNALEFELHFWVSVRTLMERRQIESDVRFNLDHLFREAGITIAFPQRDVHLTTAQPIRVQVTPPEPAEAA
jgi:small-conductance mechanosensitive channel